MLERSTLALLLAAAPALGCGLTTVSSLPATVTMKFGQDIQLTEPDVVVRFAEVLQDSRCPIDVVCVQEGSATLRFSVIEPDGDLFTVILETGKPPESTIGLTFRLISVDPAPRAGQHLDPANYSATIEITHTP